MNRETAAQFLPLVKALAEGKTIQYLNDSDEWEDLSSPTFLPTPERHRIKPEPRVIWVNEYEASNYAYPSEKQARERATPGIHRIAVRYVEAPEEGGEA